MPTPPHTPGTPAVDSIWCAIPVYNNAATIRAVVQRCRRELPRVVVIDDGSTDADLRELLADLDLPVLRHPRNLGKGAALLTALRFAATQGATYLLTLDGDGQHFPEDIPHFLQRLDPAAILIGRRETVLGTMPRSSRFGREFSDFWIHVESGSRASDTQSGFRVYPVDPTLSLHFCTRHYNFEMEVVTRAVWAGLDVHSVPIRVWYPDADHSQSSFRPFLDNLRISLLHSRLVGRRLWPWPHRRLVAPQPNAGPPRWRARDSASPLNLAAAAGVGALLGVLPPWPFWTPVVCYLAIRLHLNKLMVLAAQFVGLIPWIGAGSLALGYFLCHGTRPGPNTAAPPITQPLAVSREQWLGALLLAPLFAAGVAALVYVLAGWLRSRCPPRWATPPAAEPPDAPALPGGPHEHR